MSAYVVILDLHKDGGPVAPSAPMSWERTKQGETGWYTFVHPSGPPGLAAYLVGSIPGPPDQGLFALFGSQSMLEHWAPDAMPAVEMFRRRGEPAVGRMMRVWPVWVVDDDTGSEVRRRLTPQPAGLPSIGLPWGTVTHLHRPALDVTQAGHALDQTLENQPDRGEQ